MNPIPGNNKKEKEVKQMSTHRGNAKVNGEHAWRVQEERGTKDETILTGVLELVAFES